MTAEIVIINRQGVAMAADSIVTLTTPTGDKTYSTANKLFALSYNHSIGIMIHNNSFFMGLPWETLIHLYREKIKNIKFPTLEECVDKFVAFIETAGFWSTKLQIENAVREFEIYHENIFENLKNSITTAYEENSGLELTREEQIEIMKGELERFLEENESSRNYERDYNEFLDTHKQELDTVCLNIYESVYPELKDSLNALNKNYFNKMADDYSTGVVFSGFGDDDITPKVCSLKIDRLLCNKLAYVNEYGTKGCMDRAKIFPFAQREMVDAFVGGINPEFLNYIFELIDFHYPYRSEDFLSVLIKHSNDVYMNPILTSLEYLGKTELAMMAEMLVNLTSFKQKISDELETVGGPTDVAVISKGEGFVWIKRKYYFEKEINPHFIAKYYKEERKNGEHGTKNL